MEPENAPRIISAREENLPAISQLAGVIWRACYPGIITPDQIEYMLSRMYSLETLREQLNNHVHYPLLFLNNELVGFASYGTSDDPAVFKLHRLYLHPDCHGRGLGSFLLRHCEQQARNLGGRRLILNVNKRNAKAMAVYRRNGYRIIESVVLDIGNGFVMDDYVLAKELDKDAGSEAKLDLNRND